MTNFLIFGFSPEFAAKVPQQDIPSAFARKLRWSFYWLAVGCWPKRDEHGNEFQPNSPDALKAGTPLAQGFFGILWIVRGDLD